MLFRTATQNDAEAIYSLYRSVIGQKFCTWNDIYPGLNEINHDIETCNTFLLIKDEIIIGAASIVPENELDELSCWNVKQNAKEIARVVIAPLYQGQGYAKILAANIIAELKSRKCSAVHLSVAAVNIPAYKTYQGLGFITVGEADMYGNHYYLCEKIL